MPGSPGSSGAHRCELLPGLRYAASGLQHNTGEMNVSVRKGRRYKSYTFTEQGVAQIPKIDNREAPSCLSFNLLRVDQFDAMI